MPAGDPDFRGAAWREPIGSWLAAHYKDASARIIVSESVPLASCPGGCGGADGVCNAELGECRCRYGRQGANCQEVRTDNPCNFPSEHRLPIGRYVASMCPGACDTSTARCHCGANSSHPQRLVSIPCGLPDVEPQEFEFLDLDRMYSTDPAKPGWCNAELEKVRGGQQEPRQNCPCTLDGWGGLLCEEPMEAFCMNQCSTQGTCRSGFCQCRAGWFGIDCSTPSLAAGKGEGLPLWLQGVLPMQQGSAGDSTGPEADTAVRTIGDLAALPQRLRPRPLIYIYDLPPEFTYHNIEGRMWPFWCAQRMYQPWDNGTIWNPVWLYSSEVALLEGLLSSPHRTSNPEAADYFYVPVLGACLQQRVEETPATWHDPRYRPNVVLEAYQRAFEHIRGRYPFWNRTQGRDHIWFFPYDEGACYAPQAIWESVMLTHWGNTESHHKGTCSAYWHDSWQHLPRRLRGTHPCFDPRKDIVIPPFKAPSRFWQAASRPSQWLRDRPTLFYFNGNLGPAYGGRPEDHYSMGIRQKVAAEFGSIPNQKGQLGAQAEPGVVVSAGARANYSEELALSRFCGVFPGDGFSARMEDSILHGCIPVIIQDGIEMEFENVLDFGAFAVRISEADIPNMVRILKAIPEQRVQAMLSAVAGLWQRFSWHSAIRLEAQRQRAKGLSPEWAPWVEGLRGDDAIDTVLQVLLYRLHTAPWRSRSR